jgi:hypothetical protein
MKNGEMLEEGFKMLASQMLGSDPVKIKTALEVLAICNKIDDADMCEKSAQIAECLTSEGRKKGLELVL